MRIILLIPTLVLCLAFVLPAEAQPLVCPGSEIGNCQVFHYHVQVYRADTKNFTEFFGLNSFASLAACEADRTQELARNKTVVDYFKRLDADSPFQPNRFGACHCDMTSTRGNANFLEPAQRMTQFRTERDLAWRLRERLLDTGAKPESEPVRALNLRPFSLDPAAWPKSMTVAPATTSVPATPPSASELKETSAAAEAPRTVAPSSDLTLVDVSTPSSAPPRRNVPPPPPSTADIEIPATPETPAAETTTTTTESTTQVAETEGNGGDAETDRFFSVETQRVQNIIRANSAVSDVALKNRIFEASTQRLQLLNNLQTIVEGAGSRSKLAAAVRAANDESKRIELAAKLFGAPMRSHWAPKDAGDVIFDAPSDITDDPAAVLRDTTGRFNDAQKRLALYILLARSTALTASQEVWLVGVIESFL